VGCTSSVEAAAAATATAAPTAEPTPAEPDGFPFVSAGSIAVIESSCGALIYGRNEREPFPPASLTKLMTAAVATDQADVTMMITAHVDGAALYDATGSTIMGLVPGMQLSLRDLLYGLLLPSGNDAAIAIAEGISGSEDAFVELMNAKAQSLALGDTHFTNPHGLYEDGLTSSARDMAMLARYVMQNADLREIVRTVEYQPAWDGPSVWNGNRLLGAYAGADGVKIGYTEESQQTIVASASRDNRRIIIALLRSQDRYTDAERLFDWAFAEPSACP
jgi:D-alanyl-D-alanine carboxypeptidase